MELTRRMTPSRNCFSRIAGAYMDPEGYDNGTFNVHFGKLGNAETKRNLEIAKAIPFAKENEELVEYRYSDAARKSSMSDVVSMFIFSGKSKYKSEEYGQAK